MVFKFNKKSGNVNNEIKTFEKDIINEKSEEKYNVGRLNEISQGLINSIVTKSESSVSVGLIGISKLSTAYLNLDDAKCRNEIKNVCQNGTDYEKVTDIIRGKLLRKSLISFVSETIIPTIINSALKNKCGDSGARKVIYAFNIPTLVGIVGGEATDIAINKFELNHYYHNKNVQDHNKIQATNFYLGKCKTDDGSSYTFTKYQKSSLVNKFIGSSINSIICASLACVSNVFEKRTCEYEETSIEE